MQNRTTKNNTIRFNLPLDKDTPGVLQIDGRDERFVLTQGTGFTAGSKTITATAGNTSIIALCQAGQMGRWSSDRFESLDPLDVIVKEITTEWEPIG